MCPRQHPSNDWYQACGDTFRKGVRPKPSKQLELAKLGIWAASTALGIAEVLKFPVFGPEVEDHHVPSSHIGVAGPKAGAQQGSVRVIASTRGEADS